MMLVFSLLGLTIDGRLLRAASACGRSLAYFRLDVGNRTALKADVEWITPAFREGARVEFDVAVLGWAWSTRSWYGVGAC